MDCIDCPCGRDPRVSDVQLSRRVEGEVFGVRVTGVVYGGEETRIHVPEASIAGDAMR